jgi:hypothetical protein
MSTDPKKNDEIKDEELEMVSGGAGDNSHDEQPDGDPALPSSSTPGKGGREGS